MGSGQEFQLLWSIRAGDRYGCQARATCRANDLEWKRQRYPISDMVFSANQLVSKLSHDITLLPGDVICCGTSVGVGTMREKRNVIDVEIEGIGRLTNAFVQ
jgi:2-keto-4-pentenoate hydratase/2-oxohepta-3-ene-1,7-dioic acid hydratase in catechol pathway